MDGAHRFRGLVRTSFTAGITMSAIATAALALGLATGLVPSSIFGARELVAVAIRSFGAGALAGGLFAWFVAHGERGQTLSTVSTRRVTLWGGLVTGSVFLLVPAVAASSAVPIRSSRSGQRACGCWRKRCERCDVESRAR
jgi:hypothetical protein